MLFLAKLGAIAELVCFYVAGKDHHQPPIKWAVIGLIGYWLTWWLVDKTFIAMLPNSMTRSAGMGFLVMQIPALSALVTAYLIRQKLISDATAENKSDTE